MSDNGGCTGIAQYWPCGRPAKFWIVDEWNRTGWNGRQYLCGVHARAYNKLAPRRKKPLAYPLDDGLKNLVEQPASAGGGSGSGRAGIERLEPGSR